MMDMLRLKGTLTTGLSGSEIEVRDLTGGGDHFHIRVVAPQFEGLNRVARHRLIHALLKEELKGAIHAIKLETIAPSEI